VEGEEILVADATDREALSEAFAGSAVVAALAGPYTEIGTAPAEAALTAGCHYLDVTGEQAFARRIHTELGPRAVERRLVFLTAFGFDFVPGDLAARLAADGLAEIEELTVAYAISGAAASRGTKRTVALLAGRPHVALVDGKLVEARFGETTRRVTFPFGEREVVEWGGTEPITVPRHTDVRTVRSYVRLSAAVRAAAPLARVAAPLAQAMARFAADGPSEEERRAARFTVVAEARGPARGRRATLVGSDIYLLTARLVAEGARALAAGEIRGAGALAPAEAFPAERLLHRLEPLMALAGVDEL
jgi:short subunit dehydrogenase-like uncharacterized protein